jgi:methylenetetrahydrofolate dehydrogenase (NADP+)/methenyltetrahydrofolate cyclohydrolase
MDANTVVRRLAPHKDVDGFHPVNVGKLLIGEKDGFAPCTPAGVQELLVRYGIETKGKEVVIIGRSNIVGKPMAALLVQSGQGADCTITICHSRTKISRFHTKRADIVIAAIGKPEMLTGAMIPRPVAVVIDVASTASWIRRLPRAIDWSVMYTSRAHDRWLPTSRRCQAELGR